MPTGNLGIKLGGTENVKVRCWNGPNGSGTEITSIPQQMVFSNPNNDPDITIGTAINFQTYPITVASTGTPGEGVTIGYTMPGLNPATGTFLIDKEPIKENATIP